MRRQRVAAAGRRWRRFAVALVVLLPALIWARPAAAATVVVDFNAEDRPDSTGIVITWRTTAEDSYLAFNVQRSLDGGLTWDALPDTVLTDGAPKPYQVVDTWPGAVGEVEYRLTLFDPIDPGDVQILATFVFEVEPRTPTPTETEPPTVAPSATPVPAASGTTLPTSSPTPLAGETQGAPRSPQPTASPGPAATASQPARTATATSAARVGAPPTAVASTTVPAQSTATRTARPTASGPRTPSPAILAVDSAGGSGLQAASASATTRLPTAPRLLVTVAGIAVVLAALCAVAGFVVWRRT